MSAYQGFPPFREWRPPFDEQTTGAALNAMKTARLEYGEQALEDAVTVATRSTAVETGAFEGLYETTRGFTLSIAEEATGWSKKLHRRGTDVERHVHDALAGYEFILDAVTGERPISPHWIRSLHATLCQSQRNYEVLIESPGGLVPKRDQRTTTLLGPLDHSRRHRLVRTISDRKPYNRRIQALHGIWSSIRCSNGST